MRCALAPAVARRARPCSPDKEVRAATRSEPRRSARKAYQALTTNAASDQCPVVLDQSFGKPRRVLSSRKPIESAINRVAKAHPRTGLLYPFGRMVTFFCYPLRTFCAVFKQAIVLIVWGTMCVPLQETSCLGAVSGS